MKEPLDRLLAQAAQALPPPPSDVSPYGLETRVLAHWRSALADDVPVEWRGIFRQVLAGASALMLLSVLVNFDALQRWRERATQPADLAMADSALYLALNP